MFIQTQATPNPATIKFIPGETVSDQGLKDYRCLEDAEHSPLAQRLFGLQGVVGVFLGPDFVSVSKADDTDWSMLKPMVMAALMEHFSTGQPVLLVVESQASGDENDDDVSDEISLQIKELIETRVRPMVMMDGGDIAFERFEADGGIVYLSMRGACAGCPSSTATLKSGIENMLQHFVPEVVEVRPVD